MTTQVKEYVHNLETSKIELHFTKEEYQALTDSQKRQLRSSYLFSGKQQAWVSRSKNNHYRAIQTAEQLEFKNGGKVGERLSYVEELERQQERAEARMERYNTYADNAERRAENLQSEWKKASKDWSFVTQPNINSSAGRSFSNYRERIINRWQKGFDEYRKSDYFKNKAATAQMTANQSQLKNRSYLSNRIDECNKHIRQLERAVIKAEETNNSEWLEDLLPKMEYEMDKLAYMENCVEELGGVQYSKENVKPGYLVKVRNDWGVVKKANTKTVDVQFDVVPYTLRYTYTEIQNMKIPDNWTNPSQESVNPFHISEFVTRSNVMGDRIIKAFQVVGVTAKSIKIQEVKIEDNKPITDAFISDKMITKKVKEYRDTYVVNDGDWYLYRYNN